jgi:hypothetical protein
MMTATFQLFLLLPSGHSPGPFDFPFDFEVIVDLESIIYPMELDVLLSPLVDPLA